ncbi:ABC-three component system protein [Priestia endophytica]|uniref:ABC-three component system protein n=1 Tax=Priestia endophytica TaxID=135735 RepID=UPI00124D309C|nr:ABC-three component system protein [Priestia endophytica]KAB2489976.1 SMEK domain-containing protein [Priestia endophytica]
MNRDFYFNYITEKIEILCYKIKSMGKLNILNLNIHAEFFYRDLCNLVYGLSLENANVEKQNIAAIDLIDRTEKILIQVSSTCTKGKINSTLSKENLLDYKEQGYVLKFLFFSDAKNLRGNTFDNVHGITFNPLEHIIDKNTILNSILECEVDKQIKIYELVKKELGETPDPSRISTNLADLINLLSEEDLGTTSEVNKLNEYNIDCKIDYNNLNKLKSIINQYKIYYTKIDAIYKEFDKQGNNKSLSVFNKLSRFYVEESLKENTNENQIFFNIINRTVDHIRESSNYNILPDEELEQCVSIIIVDAFIRCKVFENPEGYEHVIA